MADDDTILRVMRRLKDLGGMVVIHCESNHLIEEDQRKAEQLNQVSAKWHASTRSELAELSSVRGILDIAEAIEALIKDAPLRQRLAARAKQLAEPYSWQKCAAQTWDYIAQIYQDRSKRAEITA